MSKPPKKTPAPSKPVWIWADPLPGTTLFPHHKRWAARLALVDALRNTDDAPQALMSLARADAFISIMFDCHDPLASAYARRSHQIRELLIPAD